MGSIELKTKNHALLLSKLEINTEDASIAKWVEQALEGSKPLQCLAGSKRKADITHDIPRFCQGYKWTDTSSLSPSATFTEIASPLPSPPFHLLSDPLIKIALSCYHNSIKIETPFDVNCFKNLFFDHPNPAFVASIMSSLCNGF